MTSLTGEVNKFEKRMRRKLHLRVGGGVGRRSPAPSTKIQPEGSIGQVVALREIGYNSENKRTSFKSETTYQITDLDYASYTAGAQGNSFLLRRTAGGEGGGEVGVGVQL